MGDPGDTICAVSTPPGRGGIAVLRISGPDSLRLLRSVFRADFLPAGESPKPRRAVLGEVFDPASGEPLDQGLATFFPGPHSYTGEDVVEISVHGSPVLAGFLLESLCGLGARLAEPGEFTMRAFLSGRMDLAQAEAVRDLIEAGTLYQAQVAARQRGGALSHQLADVKKQLLDLVVDLESAVEFGEEAATSDRGGEILTRLGGIHCRIGQWVDSYQRGRILRDGFQMAIVGSPNVGKSSLFNSLLVQERSIVTEIPGTTRDLVAESVALEGIPVRLLDTAGVQASPDRLEQLGVDRSYRAIADADAILLVVDGSRPPSAGDSLLRERLAGYPCVVVVNKSDLAPAWSGDEKEAFAGARPWLDVSAKTGMGLDLLRAAIKRQLFGDAAPERDGILITNLRHRMCLESVAASLLEAAGAVREGLSEEFALVHLRRGLEQLGAITGETSVEDILGEIFARFCVGK